MAQINHNISAPNDGLGDELRTAFGHQNDMNTELYNNKVDKVTGKDLSANDFTNEDKEKLDNLTLGGEANIQPDWEQADTMASDYIKNKPVEMFSSVGSFHYVDLATQTTPLTVLSGVEKKITNDTLDDTTNILNAPYGVTSMWDTTLNQLDFSQTSIGDLITIIPAIEITTTVANQEFQIYIKLGIGSDFPVTKQVYNGSLKVAGSIKVNPTRDFSIDTLDIKDYPGEIFVLSDANCTVKSGELDIKVVRKDINIVADHTHTNLSVLNAITSIVVSSWNSSISWITTNGANLIAHLTNYANPHNVTKAQVGLGNASNTSDANKPVSIATQTALNLKQNTLVSATNIKTINGATILGSGDLVIGAGVTLGETDTTAYRGDRGKTAYDHSQSAHAPTDAQKNSDITKAEIEAKLIGEITSHTHPASGGALATVLTGISFLTSTAVVATDTILEAFGKLQKQIADLIATVNGKQATLVSGTNIKTINSTSILGSGDIVISGGTAVNNDITAIKPNGIVGVVSDNSFVSGGLPSDLTTTMANTTDYNISSGLNIIQGSNTWTKYFNYNTVFLVTRWLQELTIIPSEKTATSYGVALSVKTDVSITTLDVKIVLDNSADSGKIIMYTHGQTIILATSTSILFNIGDTLKLTLERIDNKFIATFYNITLSTSTTVSYTYATDISAGSGNKLIPDVGSLGLYILGGTSKITNYKITNNGLINGLAYIGDSITVGYGASIFKNSFVENISLERNWDIFGGVGETAAKVINGLTQITTQNIPKAAIIYLGVNETQNSISIATYKANLQTIIDSLTSINCKIYLITPSPLINYNSSTYATALIEVAILNNLEYLDIYSLMKNSYDYKMQSIYTNDLTHPNDLGHSFIARKIIEKFNSNYNSGYIKNESISVLKLSPELKAEVNLGTGLNIDWSLGVQFIKVLTANTVLTFSNITPCKTITLVVSGNYTLTFPSGVNVSDVYNFDGTKTNYIQIYCVNTTTPIFLTALKNY